MQYYYGAQNILRALDEADFWKHQEMEHTALIGVVTPNLEPYYVQKLSQLGNEIAHLYSEAVKYVESVTRSRGVLSRELKIQMYNLIKKCVEQSQYFTELMEEMLTESQAVKENPTTPTLLHHMIKESKYFIGVAQLILT